MIRICYRRGDGAAALREREWLVTNGLGGYASGTIGCVPTRRFHGSLIAALPPPAGRMLAVSALTEEATADGRTLALCGEEWLDEFALEDGLPVWRHAAIEKRLLVAHGRNCSLVTWRARQPLTLRVRPHFQTRAHEGRVDLPVGHYPVTVAGLRCEVGGGLPVRFAASRGAWRALVPPPVVEVEYPVEAARGYDAQGPLVAPCELTLELAAGEEASLTISTDPWEAMGLEAAQAFTAERQRRAALVAAAGAGAQQGLSAELVLAADQFLVRKLGDSDPAARTVIAGYHWFTDWGRDTMISLEGLCLTTGRSAQAAQILRTFAGHVRDGLIPNLFPEGTSQGLYHTADATLWFFHALDRYVKVTGDQGLLRELLPVLRDIIDHHLRGTRFGIGVDPRDGLLRQGEEGYQLTWMDAKVDGWVVTPRRGKAVELNALLYNALVLLSGWLDGDTRLEAHAARLRQSFNDRFFCEERGHLFDVLDPDDASLRPNQLLAISLPHPVLDRARWEPVVRTVQRELLTPVGLRSLGPREPDYKPRYDGDLRTRDAAYHQGTVWAWLIGPFVDAHRKTFPGEDARPLLAGFDRHLSEFGAGSIAEIFDAEPPHTPRGCVAQAWSVAEVLRCLVAVETR